MTEQHFVDIVNVGSTLPVKVLGPYLTDREAMKAARGVDINLDHENYFSQIRTESN